MALSDFQEILKQARGHRSFRAFGALFGLPHSTVRRLEQGETTNPDQETLDALAEKLPYTADELRAIIEDRQPEPLREVASAEDIVRLAKDLPASEIKRAIQLIVDRYL